MADLIAKIGRFFAEQEAQIQETLTHVAQAPARVPPPSRPPPPVHRIPTHPVDLRSPVPSPAVEPPRSNSLVRRRLSLRSQEVQDPVPYQSKARPVASLPRPPPRRLPTEDIWSHGLSGELISWASSSPASTDRSGGFSSKDEEGVSQTSLQVCDRERKPRPPQQKHRKRSRKKKRGVRSGNQEEEHPDPEEVAKANAVKVAAALVVAQERARRIRHEKLQLEQEREVERQEAALRLEEQMLRIEAVRAKSFRQSSSSLATARSSLSESGSSHDTESVWTADSNEMEPHRASSQFMMELETQLREKMSLEMHVKQSCLEKHKQRERVRLKLERILHQNAVQSSSVARLSARKASLEMELAAVLDKTARTRQERRELELLDENERLKRQREAERELQIRLREEEWSSMMEEEKARAQVAAQARVKASKRVEAHSAKLRKLLEYRGDTVSSSARSSNNDSDDESDAASARQNTDERMNKPARAFKMNFFLPPELADFEEDGLYNERLDPVSKGNRTRSSEENSDVETFTWQVPSFPDKVKFTKVLADLLSDEEE